MGFSSTKTTISLSAVEIYRSNVIRALYRAPLQSRARQIASNIVRNLTRTNNCHSCWAYLSDRLKIASIGLEFAYFSFAFISPPTS